MDPFSDLKENGVGDSCDSLNALLIATVGQPLFFTQQRCAFRVIGYKPTSKKITVINRLIQTVLENKQLINRYMID